MKNTSSSKYTESLIKMAQTASPMVFSDGDVLLVQSEGFLNLWEYFLFPEVPLFKRLIGHTSQPVGQFGEGDPGDGDVFLHQSFPH